MASTNEWWASLTIAQKERIAGKAKLKNEADKDIDPSYPACSQWWNGISDERKQAIHDHCTDSHGYLLPEWTEGKSMSY